MTSDNTDIVIRLRSLANVLAMGEWVALKNICASAADEIVHLRQQIVLLRAERDEVRRELCKRVSKTIWNPQFPLMSEKQYAEERAWDCFKENKR